MEMQLVFFHSLNFLLLERLGLNYKYIYKLTVS